MGSFYMESTQINYRRDETLKTVDQKLQELSETSAIDTDIAPVFKSTNTYQPGDMVYYRNKLYVFNVEHTGTWAAADVTATDVTTEISSLKSSLTDLSEEVNGDATTYPYADVITIEDAVPSNLADCSVKIEPVQDLHGQSAPYVGGAGKNKLPLVLATLKSLNTDGTWNDNVYTINNGTITVNTDDGGNVTSIKTNGTFNANTTFNLLSDIKDVLAVGTDIIINGCPLGGGATRYVITANNVGNDTGDGVSGAVPSIVSKVAILIYASYNVDNLLFKPMIRLATETDATFAPYTNLCPISGHTEASVEVTDGDETTKTYTIALGDTIYGGTVDFDSGVMTVDRAIMEYDGSADENWERYSIGSAGSYAMQIINTALDNRSIPSSNMLVGIPENATWGDYDGFISILSGQNPGQHKFITGIKSITTVEDWTTYLSSHTLQVCYKLATPTTIQLTPQQIQLLKGQNTLTASTGQISVTANGVAGSIGAVQEQVNATDAVLAELAADIAERLPDAPTTDGAYVLTVTVADGTPTYSWVSGS